MTTTPQLDSEELRQQLEEFALHIKPGTTKGKHRTAIFDTVELTNLVYDLIAADRTAFAEQVLAVLPEKRRSKTISGQSTSVVNTSFNEAIDQVTTAITKLVAERRGDK